MEEKWAQFSELGEASIDLNRAKVGERGKTVFATSDELQTLPHPSLTPRALIFTLLPLTDLSSTLKVISWFHSQGAKKLQRWGRSAKKTHSSNDKGTHIPGALVGTSCGEMPRPRGHSQGPPASLPHSPHAACKFKAVFKTAAFILIFSGSKPTGNCSEGDINGPPTSNVNVIYMDIF